MSAESECVLEYMTITKGACVFTVAVQMSTRRMIENLISPVFGICFFPSQDHAHEGWRGILARLSICGSAEIHNAGSRVLVCTNVGVGLPDW